MKQPTLPTFDRIFLALIVYPVLPLLFLLLGWWGSLPFFQDKRVALFALIGLITGILLNHIYLKKHLPQLYEQSDALFFCIALFYNIGLFGFFMGVPLFHVVLGIPIGIFVARQTMEKKGDEEFFQQRLKKISTVSAIIMTLVCFASAFFALRDPYTSANLRGMLSLSFSPTLIHILGLIGFGGVGLIAGQLLLITTTARHVYRRAFITKSV